MMGIDCVAFLTRLDCPVRSLCHDDVNPDHQLCGKHRKPILLPFAVSVCDGDVLSFDVATLAQSQANSLSREKLSNWIEK
jgi:hypothetical protein